MNRQKIIENATRRFLDSLEAEYAEARRDELGILHNRMVDALTEVGASPQNVLLVLELLKQETLQDCLDKFFGKTSEPQKEVELSEKAPSTIQGSKKPQSVGGVG